MCALNQDLCKLDAPIEDFDEIAFFPQVTGVEAWVSRSSNRPSASMP